MRLWGSVPQGSERVGDCGNQESANGASGGAIQQEEELAPRRRVPVLKYERRLIREEDRTVPVGPEVHPPAVGADVGLGTGSHHRRARRAFDGHVHLEFGLRVLTLAARRYEVDLR